MASHAICQPDSPLRNVTNTSDTGGSSLGLHTISSNIATASRINANIMRANAVICDVMKTGRMVSSTITSNTLGSVDMKAKEVDISTINSATMSFSKVANGNQNGSNDCLDNAILYRVPFAVMVAQGSVEPSSVNTDDRGAFPYALHSDSIQPLACIRSSHNRSESRHAAFCRARLFADYSAGQRCLVISQMKAMFSRVPPYYRPEVIDGARAVPIPLDVVRNTNPTAITTDPNAQNSGSYSDHPNDSSSQQLQFESLEAELWGCWNNRFRSLSREIREMILGFAITWDGKRSPNLIVGLRSDKQLYREALKAFASNHTFVFHGDKTEMVNKFLPRFMPLSVWESIRNLRIDHEYVAKKNGIYGHFVHRDTTFESRYTPCKMCNFQLFELAKKVRSLHLDFGKCRHCKLSFMVDICRAAVKSMNSLEFLVLELSNICCRHTIAGPYDNEIALINVSLGIKAKMLAVGTEFNTPSAELIKVATDSFFWQAQKGGVLNWTDQNEVVVKQSM